jgi:hypothetical protein
MFPELLRLALVAGARIARLLADAGHDSADNRWLCLREGIQPLIRKIGSEHGSGLGVVRSVVENANAWLLNNKRLDRRHDRSAGIIQSLLRRPRKINALNMDNCRSTVFGRRRRR